MQQKRVTELFGDQLLRVKAAQWEDEGIAPRAADSIWSAHDLPGRGLVRGKDLTMFLFSYILHAVVFITARR